MTMTNKEVLTLVNESKKKIKSLTHITDKKTLSIEDKFKISLCKRFVKHMNLRKISLTDLSKKLHMPKSRVSEIVNYKISKYSIEKLLQNINKLAEISPETSAYLDLINEAIDIPFMKAKDTKKLTKKIKDIGRTTSRLYSHA